MLQISDAQLKTIGQAAEARFLADLVARLEERTPELARTLAPEQRREAVSAAVRRAADHGFTHRGPIRLYLDLCVGFGSGFAADPVHGWAAEALGAPDPDTQTLRAEALYERSLAVMDVIQGPEDIHARQALEALARWAVAEHRFEGVDLETVALQDMSWLHPQKAELAGEAALRALFRQARADCAALGSADARACMLTTALKFGFGAGCLDDPLYPWIGGVLRDARVPEVADRFARLERRALTWLDAILTAEG